MTIQPYRPRKPPHARRCLSFVFFLLSVLYFSSLTSALAQTVDPHVLFEDECGRCHGHAGTFAREKLIIENGEVVGRQSGKRVLDVLPQHFGRLTDEEILLVEGMFRRQIEADGLYEKKCRICHDSAKDLARRMLALRDGQLVGRYSGQPIADLLSYHGRAQDDERGVLLDMLAWHLATDSR